MNIFLKLQTTWSMKSYISAHLRTSTYFMLNCPKNSFISFCILHIIWKSWWWLSLPAFCMDPVKWSFYYWDCNEYTSKPSPGKMYMPIHFYVYNVLISNKTTRKSCPVTVQLKVWPNLIIKKSWTIKVKHICYLPNKDLDKM